MQHVLNKAHTHAVNHKHGSTRHNQAGERAPKAADEDVFGKPTGKRAGVTTLTEAGALLEP